MGTPFRDPLYPYIGALDTSILGSAASSAEHIKTHLCIKGSRYWSLERYYSGEHIPEDVGAVQRPSIGTPSIPLKGL